MITVILCSYHRCNAGGLCKHTAAKLQLPHINSHIGVCGVKYLFHNLIFNIFILHLLIQCNIFAIQTLLIMGQSTISIRVDDKLKKSFDELCNEIGLSNSAAVTIFMKAAVREQRIPFELRTESEEEIRAKGLAAFHKLRAIAQENGVAGMSLEEINEEIRLARRGE